MRSISRVERPCQSSNVRNAHRDISDTVRNLSQKVVDGIVTGIQSRPFVRSAVGGNKGVDFEIQSLEIGPRILKDANYLVDRRLDSGASIQVGYWYGSDIEMQFEFSCEDKISVRPLLCLDCVQKIFLVIFVPIVCNIDCEC